METNNNSGSNSCHSDDTRRPASAHNPKSHSNTYKWNNVSNTSAPVDLSVPSSIASSSINSFSSTSSSSSSNVGSHNSSSIPVFGNSNISSGLIGSFGATTNQLVTPSSMLMTNSRKQREFIPDSKKDESYWDRRKRNNEAAKRSREKRRISDLVLETRVLELTRENSILKAELYAIKEKFGIAPSQHFVDPESIAIPLPENANKIRRSRLFSSIINGTPVNLFSAAAAAADYSSNGGGNSSFNYSCSLSPNSHSSSSSEVQVSSPNYHVSTTSSPPVVCSLLGQGVSALGLGSPILPVLAGCGKTSLPFKLRHKAGNSTSNTSNGGNGSNGGGGGGVSNGTIGNGILATTNGHHNGSETGNMPTNDSDASSDSSVTVPPLNSNSIESNGTTFGDLSARDNTCSPDSVLKTENFALKSELQRLASEVATLKNVLVYSSQTVAQNAALKLSASERCNPYQSVSPVGNHSPVHYSEDLVDSKVLLNNVIQFQKLNDIIV